MTAEDPPASRPRPAAGRAAAALLGSVVALGGAGDALAQTTGQPSPDRGRRQSRRAEALPAGERALLARIFSALGEAAPGIVKPVLDRGVGGGTITPAQEERFLARLASARAAEGGSGPPAGAGRGAAPAEAPPGPAAQALFQEALRAIRAQLPAIAGPLVDAALVDATISPAQAARLRTRLTRGPQLGFGLVMRNARAAGATRLP